MPTPHNEAKLGEIAKTVIMPGDPLRAKYIAENFLDNAKLVNQVRGIFAYTGTYKGNEVTVMASGMGMPSMGIYCYELYKFYDVENIIRIGSCGAYKPELKLFDIILADKVYSESNFSLALNNEVCHIVNSNNDLNNAIKLASEKSAIPITSGNTICTDFFDVYMEDFDKFLNRIPKDINPIAAEMEAFSLFYVAKYLDKKAACLMSVVDVANTSSQKASATAEERETGLNKMITLALESLENL